MFTLTKNIWFDPQQCNYGESKEGGNANSVFIWMSPQHSGMDDGLGLQPGVVK